MGFADGMVGGGSPEVVGEKRPGPWRGLMGGDFIILNGGGLNIYRKSKVKGGDLEKWVQAGTAQGFSANRRHEKGEKGGTWKMAVGGFMCRKDTQRGRTGGSQK